MAFLDLPVELILIIAEFSAIDGDLLHLAASCHQLNLLLVPLLFARCHFALSSLTPTVTPGRSNSLGKSYWWNAYRPPRARYRVFRLRCCPCYKLAHHPPPPPRTLALQSVWCGGRRRRSWLGDPRSQHRS
ncbi:hypothetical protein C8R45DRAFT_1031416 [Mycena sanguinolenta]|nr:hypothetical protein C8R45DRAFT_1031416 [Mycena sanguinolenta]